MIVGKVVTVCLMAIIATNQAVNGGKLRPPRAGKKLDWASEGQFFEGDMRFDNYDIVENTYGQKVANSLVDKGQIPKPNHKNNGRGLNIHSSQALRWTKRNAEGKIEIAYEFDESSNSNFKSQGWDEYLVSVLREMEQDTKVLSFVPRTTETSYFQFTFKNQGCWSWVGRLNNRPNTINLQIQSGFSGGCMFSGVIVHEILHALGVWHEQSRADRDDHITVKTDSIRAGYLSQFSKASSQTFLGAEYDYESVMHYSKSAFGKFKVACEAQKPFCSKEAQVFPLIFGSSTVTLEPAGERNVKLIQNGKCLEPATNNGNFQTGLPVRAVTCTDSTFQQWQIHGSDFNGVYFKWEGDRALCLAHNYNNNEPYYTSCGFGATQYSVGLGSQDRNCPHTLNLCRDASGIEETIEAPVSVGQRTGLSKNDILEVQLMYQCPSGDRTVDTLCDAECPCFLGQKSCSDDSHCRGSLTCNEDSYCVGEDGLPFTSGPSAQPTESPSAAPTDSPTFAPTRSPTDQENAFCLGFEKKNTCNKQKKVCKWSKKDGVLACWALPPPPPPPPPFNGDCSTLTSKKTCNKEKKVCKWQKVDGVLGCQQLPPPPPPPAPFDGDCSTLTKKKTCNKEKNVCKWRKLDGVTACYSVDAESRAEQSVGMAGCERATYDKAIETCAKFDKHLCSAAEIEAGLAIPQTNCNNYKQYVWIAEAQCGNAVTNHDIWREHDKDAICKQGIKTYKFRCC